MPTAAKVFDILFTVFVYLLAAAILFGAVLFAFNTSADKALFGYRYYTILTGSMSPTYKVGDMIFVKLSNDSEISVGDVITFNPSQDSDAYLTHRVSEKLENYEGTGVTCYRTKGDANDVGDSFLIDGSRVIGKVTFSIPGLGYVVRFIQLRWYLIVPVVVMIGVFFLLLKRYFLMGKEDDEEDDDKKKKSKKAEAESEADNISSDEKKEEKSDGEAEQEGSEAPEAPVSSEEVSEPVPTSDPVS